LLDILIKEKNKLEDLLNSLSTYGYIILFLYSFGGGFFALVAAGALSYMGKMDITTSIAVAAVANYIGDMFLFYMARYNKGFAKPYMSNHRRKVALSHVLIKKYGDFVIFIQKFIYGVKTLVPIAFGLSKYSFVKFGILNAPASLVFSLFFGLLSYYGGEQIVKAFGVIKENPIIMPIVLVTFGSLIWWYFSVATKKK
jgi:membrane protein DedA with SNARE-associated domain